MVKEYTERYKGFQIRDVVYLGEPPTDIPPTFDVVKWGTYNVLPEAMNLVNADGTIIKSLEYNSELDEGYIEEYCYTVGTLEYNAKEPCFEFKSCGLRWLEAHPDEDVENWIIKWCDYKLQELYTD